MWTSVLHCILSCPIKSSLIFQHGYSTDTIQTHAHKIIISIHCAIPHLHVLSHSVFQVSISIVLTVQAVWIPLSVNSLMQFRGGLIVVPKLFVAFYSLHLYLVLTRCFVQSWKYSYAVFQKRHGLWLSSNLKLGISKAKDSEWNLGSNSKDWAFLPHFLLTAFMGCTDSLLIRYYHLHCELANTCQLQGETFSQINFSNQCYYQNACFGEPFIFLLLPSGMPGYSPR